MKNLSKLLMLLLCLLMIGSTALADNAMEAYCPLVEEPAELTWWTTRMASVADFETQTQTAYMEELTGVHINWQQVDLAEKDTKLNLSLASGDYPDVYMTAFTADQVMMYAGDVFIPIEDYITPEITPNLCRVLEENPSVRDLITAPDGHIYTLFRTDTGVHMLALQKMFVNTDWLNAYIADGGKMPETTDEFKAMLVYFRDHDMNGNGDASDEMPLVSSSSSWAGDPINYFANAWILVGNGSQWETADADGNITYAANTDEFREALKYMNDLYNEGLLMEETYVQDQTQMQALINNTDDTQLVVGAFSAAWQGVYVDNTIVNYADYTPIPPLAGPDGLRQTATCSESGFAEFLLQCAITTACEDVELAMRYLDLGFVEYVPGDDYLMLSGAEGVCYTWSTEVESMNGLSPTRVDIPLGAVQSEKWENHTTPYWDTNERRYNVYADDISGNKYLYDAAMDYEPYYVYVGFPLITWCDDADLAAEVAELDIALDEYVKASYTQFITGVRDIHDDAAWEGYKAELDGIGLEDYLEGRRIVSFGE